MQGKTNKKQDSQNNSEYSPRNKQKNLLELYYTAIATKIWYYPPNRPDGIKVRMWI